MYLLLQYFNLTTVYLKVYEPRTGQKCDYFECSKGSFRARRKTTSRILGTFFRMIRREMLLPTALPKVAPISLEFSCPLPNSGFTQGNTKHKGKARIFSSYSAKIFYITLNNLRVNFLKFWRDTPESSTCAGVSVQKSVLGKRLLITKYTRLALARPDSV